MVYVPYPMFVWMRQMNECKYEILERLQKLEAGQSSPLESLVDQRAEISAEISTTVRREAERVSALENMVRALAAGEKDE